MILPSPWQDWNTVVKNVKLQKPSIRTLLTILQLKKLEEDIKPLQSEMREIESERDALRAEKKTILAESERWKLRTNQLIEQAHKTDPEEHKKLV